MENMTDIFEMLRSTKSLQGSEWVKNLLTFSTTPSLNEALRNQAQSSANKAPGEMYFG